MQLLYIILVYVGIVVYLILVAWITECFTDCYLQED